MHYSNGSDSGDGQATFSMEQSRSMISRAVMAA